MMFKFLQGKKAYLSALAIAALAAAQYLGYEIPEWVSMLLASFGITASRVAVTRLTK